MSDEINLPEVDDSPKPIVSEETSVVNKVTEEDIINPKPDEEVSETKKKPIQEYEININKLKFADHLHLPADNDDKTRDVLNNLPNVGMMDSNETRNWAQSLSEGLELNTFNSVFADTLKDPSADFHQEFKHNGAALNAASPKFKQAENENLKGERAVIRVVSHLGIGTIFQVPLWHSGIWVTFKPPTESEIVELNRMLISDKIKFGRYSYGLAFSNTTVYTTDRLVDFALSHIYDLTVKSEEINMENIKSHISCQDIPSLLWGFICTMYPRGFNYSRSCIADPEKCNHIVEETINVSKLQWTNTSAFTEWQKAHMSSRQPKLKTLESVKRYKEELTRIQKNKIDIKGVNGQLLSITIKTPTITEYVDSGHRWIGDIVETVEKSIGADVNKSERDNVVIRHGQASAMRQYCHWVESIEYESNIIDDKETVEQVLSSLSGDDEIRTTFVSEIVKYINNSTVSVIGIPSFDCPKCGTSQDTKHMLPRLTDVLPLDVIQVFFGLITQRLSRLTER